MRRKAKAKKTGQKPDDVQFDVHRDTITLYRGLGLPAKAIKIYHDFLESQMFFHFTAFTSTSIKGGVAVKFAYQALARDLVPTIFVLETNNDEGRGKAFLHDETLSAFPGEQEYLIGPNAWKVTKMEEKKLKLPGRKKFKATVIYLKQPY